MNYFALFFCIAFSAIANAQPKDTLTRQQQDSLRMAGVTPEVRRRA